MQFLNQIFLTKSTANFHPLQHSHPIKKLMIQRKTQKTNFSFFGNKHFALH